MYCPRNWEFGSALSTLRNFGGGGFEPHNPSRHATDYYYYYYYYYVYWNA
jgi:hypothetical protein